MNKRYLPLFGGLRMKKKMGILDLLHDSSYKGMTTAELTC